MMSLRSPPRVRDSPRKGDPVARSLRIQVGRGVRKVKHPGAKSPALAEAPRAPRKARRPWNRQRAFQEKGPDYRHTRLTGVALD